MWLGKESWLKIVTKLQGNKLGKFSMPFDCPFCYSRIFHVFFCCMEICTQILPCSIELHRIDLTKNWNITDSRALDSRVERIYFWRQFFELFAIEKKNSLLKFLTFIKIFNFFYQFLSRRKRRLLWAKNIDEIHLELLRVLYSRVVRIYFWRQKSCLFCQVSVFGQQ